MYNEIPVIHNREELKAYLQDTYIIEDIIKDDTTFNKVLKNILNLIRGSIVIKSCREYPIKFKFYMKDSKVHTLELRHFYVNLILWNPFIEVSGISKILDESFIFDCNNVNSIISFINYKIIDVLREYLVKPTDIQFRISDVFFHLTQISVDFSLIMGLNFDGKTFIELYKNDSEIRDIMEVEFDETLQPSEVEGELARLQNREIEIYKNDPKNPIGVILSAQTGIKHKQLGEFTISQGYKPTLEGITIPKPINNSTILRGLDRPSYYYIGASASRKSLVTNKKVMGRAGYFGKKILLLSRTLSMETDCLDCGSKHLVKYVIKTNKHLNKLNGKFFKFKPKSDEDLKVVNEKNTELIGKTIYIRSASTCALNNNKVCPTCVGLNANLNYDISDGISAYESEEFSKVIEQNILSTKHLLTTNSEEIKFNKEFDDFFNIIGGEITPKITDGLQNILDYAIVISPEDMTKQDDQEYDSLYNNIINGKFKIRNLKNKWKEDIVIEAEYEKEIFLSEEASAILKKHNGLIPFSELNDDIKLFEVIILNRELTKPLYDLIDLLDKKNPNHVYDIDEFSQSFLDLLIESGIPAGIISAELITNRLLRSRRNIYKRPNFSEEVLEPYEIKTVNWCLENNESPLVGLSYQNTKKQLLSDTLYTERDAESFIDPLYWKQVPTDQLSKYKDRAPRMRVK